MCGPFSSISRSLFSFCTRRNDGFDVFSEQLFNPYVVSLHGVTVNVSQHRSDRVLSPPCTCVPLTLLVITLSRGFCSSRDLPKSRSKGLNLLLLLKDRAMACAQRPSFLKVPRATCHTLLRLATSLSLDSPRHTPSG